MTKEEILARLPEQESVFGLKRTPLKDGEESTAEIPVSELTVRPKGLFWPGPEGEAKPALYCYTDYGTTWAFTLEEIHPIERVDEEKWDD